MSFKLYKDVVALPLFIILPALVSLAISVSDSDIVQTQTNLMDDNTIESHKMMDCGTTASNTTRVVLKNPNYPEPTYTGSVCETVIERVDPSIKKLKFIFKQLELYRPTVDGQCMHDRFAVYTDLNTALTPILCGNQTGRSFSIPFSPSLTSLIVSITTSDLDHDRNWILQIEQE